MLIYKVGSVARLALRSQSKLLLQLEQTCVILQYRHLSPLAEYQKRVSSGQLKHDNKQQQTMQALDDLYNRLQGYKPSTQGGGSGGGFFSSLFGSKSSDSSDADDDLNAGSHAPQGLYIYGSVGVGKTTLMDIFYDCFTDVCIKKTAIKEIEDFVLTTISLRYNIKVRRKIKPI